LSVDSVAAASSATKSRMDPRFATLIVLLLMTGLRSQFASFSLPLALLGLGLALVNLAWIGYAATRLLRLRRPRLLATPQYILLGQILALAYVYLRSILSDALGLPGISLAEILAVEAGLGWLVLGGMERNGTGGRSWRRPSALDVVCHGIWLSWIVAMACSKLDLHFTPSSDPDIHAFYTRIVLERGHLFYDLEPISDVWMIYPSAFSSLNLIFGRLSGLHPVQLVNIGAYLQLSLFAGYAFSVLVRPVKRPAIVLMLALVHFAGISLCFNPVFVESRSYLEGTPRLAHTAVLFFPLFFIIQHATPIARRPWLLSIPVVGTLVGMCVNPAHAPASLLVTAVAFALLVLRPRSRRRLRSTGWRSRLAIGLALAAMGGIFLSSDPFYRSLAQQQLGFWGGQVEEAERLSGSAFRPEVDLTAISDGIKERWSDRLMPRAGGWDRRRGVEEMVLVLFAVVGLALFPLRRHLGLAIAAAERDLLWLVGGGFFVLAVHGLWCEIAGVLVKPGVLQSVLLTRYSYSLQNQMSLALFALFLTATLSLAASQAERARPGGGASQTAAARIPLAIVLASLLFALPALGRRSARIAKEFHPKLRESPLGRVEGRDVEFAHSLEAMIPIGERVLLPGRVRRTGIEHWILTTGAGRALPLFTPVRTSFFLGLDGRAFTPNAYETHVRREFDEDWLRSHRILWLVESGNFPARILRSRYRLVSGNDRVNLWRLRDAGEDRG
jgi:hypothetical protein